MMLLFAQGDGWNFFACMSKIDSKMKLLDNARESGAFVRHKVLYTFNYTIIVSVIRLSLS